MMPCAVRCETGIPDTMPLIDLWFCPKQEFNFECDNKLTGLRKAVDNNCPTGAGSISDKACIPGSTVVGRFKGWKEKDGKKRASKLLPTYGVAYTCSLFGISYLVLYGIPRWYKSSRL